MAAILKWQRIAGHADSRTTKLYGRRVPKGPSPGYGADSILIKLIFDNAIESLHVLLREVLKSRGHFPSDEAATKLIYLTLRSITK